jgi:uncharacterized protein YeaO (DUF488 family)
MAIRIVRLGSQRAKGEGLRIGTVRRPPRGVPRTDYARLDFYDTWLPQIAPSAELIAKLRERPDAESSWRRFEKEYTRELLRPDNLRLLDLLAALSKQTELSVGCYCENEKRCHRSILRTVLAGRGALIS